MKRTDIHRPGAIIPTDYEMVGFTCLAIGGGVGQWIDNERSKIGAHMSRTGGTYSKHTHGGQCMLCGSVNAITLVAFYHAKTNEYIDVGDICAEKIQLSFDRSAFNVFKIAAKDALMRKAGKAKAEAYLKLHGLTGAWDVYKDPVTFGMQVLNALPYEEKTINDMVEKLIKYGSLSEKQLSFMSSLLDKDARAAKDAKFQAIKDVRAAERARHANSSFIGSIGDRREFTAVVRFVKGFHNQFGYSELTVMDEVGSDNVLKWFGRGFGEEQGTTVTFKATIKNHDEYQGVKQTQVTRCKLVSAVASQDAPQTHQDAPGTSFMMHPDPDPKNRTYSGNTWAS